MRRTLERDRSRSGFTLIVLLLKLEQAKLYNEINFFTPPYSAPNTTSVKRTTDGLVCPSNRRATSSTVTGTLKAGPSDYRGNMAAGMVLAGSNPNCPTQDASNPYCCIYDNGVTYQKSQVSMADITDGTTNTMLIGESLQGYWPDATGCCVRTNTDRMVNKPIVVYVNGTITNYHTYWMSMHPNLVNFVKCDGSIAPVTSESISSEDMK